MHANTLVGLATTPPSGIDGLVERGKALRVQLRMAVDVLFAFQKIAGPPMKALHGGSKHEELAADLSVLATFLREHWAQAETNSPATIELVNEAASLGDQLAQGLGERGLPDVSPDLARDMRNRAFTLLDRAYQEATRGMAYLRHHEDDGAKYTPSLYGGKRRGSGNRSDGGEAGPRDGQPAGGAKPLSASTAAAEPDDDDPPFTK